MNGIGLGGGVPRELVAALIVPPLSLLLAAIIGATFALRGSRAGAIVAVLAPAAVLLLATPYVSGHLLLSLDRAIAPAAAGTPGAIIVLGAETRRGPDGDEVGPLTLERLRRAAALHRATGLPVLVTSGPTIAAAPPLALAMRRALEDDFGIAVRWTEPTARNTTENAARAADLLRAEGVGSIYLVTHAWHMARAQHAAAAAGLAVVPVPVRRERIPGPLLAEWLPRADQLAMSWFALREWAALAAVRLGL